MMRRLLSFLATLSLALCTQAQAQVGDQLVVEGGKAMVIKTGESAPTKPGETPAQAKSAAGSASADSSSGSWAEYPLKDGWSGPGCYFSLGKLLCAWFLFLLWVVTTDWVNRDVQERRLNYLRWNPIVFGTFMGGFVLLWLIPIFWLGFFLLLVAYAAPLTAYILHRNSKALPHERVLTPSHIRFCFARLASKFGMKVATEAGDPHTSGPPVVLTSRGGNDRDNNVNLLRARQAPGFRTAREMVAEGLQRRGEAVMLDYGQQVVAVRHLVDGLWLDSEPRDRETGDPALEALKLLCGLNAQDRQGRQEGAFTAEYEGEKISATLATQGVPTGERALIQLERKKTKFSTYDELGMRSKIQEQLKEVLAKHNGFVLVSAMPANGLRSTTHVLVRDMDRFLREFAALEDESNRYEPIENVPVTTYKTAEKQDLSQVLDRFFHMEPNVVVCRDLVNAKMVSLLFAQTVEERLIISTVRARDCADALLQLVKMKVAPAEVAKNVTAVLNTRLVRKLCESCKEAYTPPPEVLRQLGIPEGKVQAFYRPPQPNPEERPKICKDCNGIGYAGRTGLFELLVLDDGVRKTLATQPKPDAVRLAARKAGMRSLQEEGVLLVARGVTSLPELTRVLSQ